jgi:hypothetical protein
VLKEALADKLVDRLDDLFVLVKYDRRDICVTSDFEGGDFLPRALARVFGEEIIGEYMVTTLNGVDRVRNVIHCMRDVFETETVEWNGDPNPAVYYMHFYLVEAPRYIVITTIAIFGICDYHYNHHYYHHQCRSSPSQRTITTITTMHHHHRSPGATMDSRTKSTYAYDS